MLAYHAHPGPHPGPLSPAEGTHYTELQAVDINSISSLITSSTNMCLPDTVGDSSCSEYGYPHHYGSSGAPSPHSPQSVYEEELHDIHTIIKTAPRSGADDDDDDSVMLDDDDLAFLDDYSKDLGVSAMDRHSEYRLVIAETAYTHHATYSAHHHGHMTSHPHHPAYAASSLAARYRTTPWPHHNYHSDHISSHHSARGVFPPTPSPSPKHVEDSLRTRTPTMSDMDDDDDDEDDEYKPYCDSRRGAKKNLLWKFLLWVLENQPDLAQWTDVKRGVFKFVDTARISRMWGQRKHKKDMTFEKLSRGIRHYYKRGLMERLANTRLVYKFNWEKVPRKFRKA